MNKRMDAFTVYLRSLGFRPQQGLTIMNHHFSLNIDTDNDHKGFRPQQGLTIMNFK